jgi:phospholipid/cholesterol/gamma-HCH transport system substrate-binding protein
MALLAGCAPGGFAGLYTTPLPGGADVGDHPYRITARFADVLDLVPQASVRVNDVPVGRVDRIDLAPDTRSAVVTLSVNGDVVLPADAGAELRQSSLLGEKFVELQRPAGERGTGRLGEGAEIPLSRTNRNPEVEEVLGALSLLLSGGGVAQLRTISRELNNALSGNEAEVRALLSHVDELATELDGQQGEIVRAIDGLNRLAGTLAGQTDHLTGALDDLAPGLRVLTEQRDELVGMLQSLTRLSDIAVDTVTSSRDEVVANLRALAPTLDELAKAGQDLPNALRILLTYPLPDYAGNTIKGDYANVDATVDLDLDVLLENIGNSGRPFLPPPVATGTPPGTIRPGAPALPLPPVVPPLPRGPGAPRSDGLGGVLGTLLGGGR